MDKYIQVCRFMYKSLGFYIKNTWPAWNPVYLEGAAITTFQLFVASFIPTVLTMGIWSSSKQDQIFVYVGPVLFGLVLGVGVWNAIVFAQMRRWSRTAPSLNFAEYRSLIFEREKAQQQQAASLAKELESLGEVAMELAWQKQSRLFTPGTTLDSVEAMPPEFLSEKLRHEWILRADRLIRGLSGDSAEQVKAASEKLAAAIEVATVLIDAKVEMTEALSGPQLDESKEAAIAAQAEEEVKSLA